MTRREKNNAASAICCRIHRIGHDARRNCTDTFIANKSIESPAFAQNINKETSRLLRCFFMLPNLLKLKPPTVIFLSLTAMGRDRASRLVCYWKRATFRDLASASHSIAATLYGSNYTGLGNSATIRRSNSLKRQSFCKDTRSLSCLSAA